MLTEDFGEIAKRDPARVGIYAVAPIAAQTRDSIGQWRWKEGDQRCDDETVEGMLQFAQQTADTPYNHDAHTGIVLSRASRVETDWLAAPPAERGGIGAHSAGELVGLLA